jgi:phosphotransacetylase
MLRSSAPELEVDGEMHGDAALSGDVRARCSPTRA